MLKILFSICMWLIYVKARKNWHASQVALLKLYDLQNEHITMINNYIELETKRLEELKGFLAEWQDHQLSAKGTNLQNHFNTIYVIKHIKTKLETVEHLINNDISIEALKQIDQDKDLNNHHIFMASRSLRRLQSFYMISASEMAAGRYETKTIGDPMNSCECYHILKFCLNNHEHYGVMDWAVEVYNKWKNEGQPKCVNIENLNLYSSISSILTGTNSTSLRDLNGLFHSQYLSDLKSYFNLVENDILVLNESRILKSLDFNPLHRTFTKLCKRGESNRVLTKYSKCRYQSRNSHYRRLMPFKEEDVHSKPGIKIYHDVVYDSEIKKLILVASKQMKDAHVESHSLSDDGIRLGQLFWMTEKSTTMHFQSLNNRIETLTRLSLDSSEPYQIVNYGLGGHYVPHIDVILNLRQPLIQKIGNRLLTVLFYLTDVEYGGSTVFPLLNIVSPAEKGAALVFYNLDSSDGAIVPKSLHGACPILKGNKWITTKWIHEDRQGLPYNWKQRIPKKYHDVFKLQVL